MRPGEARAGAALDARSAARLAQRNGCRVRSWDTRAGTVELAIPKLRKGRYFPTFLKPRKTAEKALLAVIQEAHVHAKQRPAVSALLRTIFTQETAEDASRPWRHVIDKLREGFPNLAEVMERTGADVLAYMGFPREH